MPVREENCPGPSALCGRVVISFTRHLYLPSKNPATVDCVGFL